MEFIDTDNLTVENNTVETAGKARQVQAAAIAGECGIGNGIFVGGSKGAQILNNTFRDISQSAILLWPSEDALIDGNEVSESNFLPCISTDFGAITLVSNTNTVVSNNFVIANDNLETGNNSAIGLNGTLDVQINHNRLEQNGSGFYIRNTAGSTTIHNNCIVKSVTGVGLLADGSDPDVNAENNFWDASDGPSGDGPTGGVLGGSGEEIDQTVTGLVDVEPFLDACRIDDDKKGKSGM